MLIVTDPQGNLPAAAREGIIIQEALNADAERLRAQVVEVPEGILVVRDQKPSADAPEPDRYWVVQDNPALSGTDIRNPEQDLDQRFGNKPIVTFELTDRGREAVAEAADMERSVLAAASIDPDVLRQELQAVVRELATRISSTDVKTIVPAGEPSLPVEAN